MRLSNLSRVQKEEEIKRLDRNIGKRIKNISNLGASYPFVAVTKYNELKQNMNKKLSSYNDKEIDSIYRQLKYIDTLKSSKVKGAKDIMTRDEIINRNYALKGRMFGGNRIKSIMYMLDEVSNGLFDKFKYEIEDVVMSKVFKGEDTMDIISDIIGAYDESLEESGGSGAKSTVLFTNKLKNFL